MSMASNDATIKQEELASFLTACMDTGQPYSVHYYSVSAGKVVPFPAQGHYGTKTRTKRNHADGTVQKREETSRPVETIFVAASTLKERKDGTKVNWGKNLHLDAIEKVVAKGKTYHVEG